MDAPYSAGNSGRPGLRAADLCLWRRTSENSASRPRHEGWEYPNTLARQYSRTAGDGHSVSLSSVKFAMLVGSLNLCGSSQRVPVIQRVLRSTSVISFLLTCSYGAYEKEAGQAYRYLTLCETLVDTVWTAR